ncbi:hypothetical protein SAMN05216178_5786 [Pseudomonas saponiphila]|uniref:Uncharacterized protein n=1 Tax=Pseudomonas saponiphila TaxID=556534 RepID=A0A1H4X6Y0_9PSED|nr:hypothetical protein [Pseudomonas saponiphila]SED00668.1 hypothetical protein SAMN05216178_5786 [Pseudomonas saponiphila]
MAGLQYSLALTLGKTLSSVSLGRVSFRSGTFGSVFSAGVEAQAASKTANASGSALNNFNGYSLIGE